MMKTMSFREQLIKTTISERKKTRNSMFNLSIFYIDVIGFSDSLFLKQTKIESNRILFSFAVFLLRLEETPATGNQIQSTGTFFHLKPALNRI